MQVFNFNRLSKGRAILLKDIANYIKQTTFITIGKYSEWTDETNPPPVTEFTSKEEVIIYKRPRLIHETDEELSDYVKVRLLLARLAALKLHEEKWG